MPDQQTFDVQGALKAGASEDDIVNFLSAKRSFDAGSAIAAGASKRDIIDFLSKGQKSPSSTANQYRPPAQPEGSAVTRFLGGIGDTLGLHSIPGVADAKQAYDDFQQGKYGSAAGHILTATNPIYAMQRDAAIAALEQAKKSADSFKKGNTSEGVGHALAAITPGGPIAANAVDNNAGTAPRFDQFGGMIDPGKAPDIARGLGQVAPLVIPAVDDLTGGHMASAVGKVAQEPAARISDAISGGVGGATQMGQRWGMPVPSVLQSGLAGGFAARLAGLPEEAGVALGASVPIIRGSIEAVKKGIKDRASAAKVAQALEEYRIRKAQEAANPVPPPTPDAALDLSPIPPATPGVTPRGAVVGPIPQAPPAPATARAPIWQGQQAPGAVPTPDLTPIPGQLPTGRVPGSIAAQQNAPTAAARPAPARAPFNSADFATTPTPAPNANPAVQASAAPTGPTVGLLNDIAKGQGFKGWNDKALQGDPVRVAKIMDLGNRVFQQQQRNQIVQDAIKSGAPAAQVAQSLNAPITAPAPPLPVPEAPPQPAPIPQAVKPSPLVVSVPDPTPNAPARPKILPPEVPGDPSETTSGMVPLASIADVKAEPFDADRLAEARKAQSPEDLPPIKLAWDGKKYVVDDGNHRLAVAREKGWPEVKAQFTGLEPDTQLPNFDASKTPAVQPTDTEVATKPVVTDAAIRGAFEGHNWLTKNRAADFNHLTDETGMPLSGPHLNNVVRVGTGIAKQLYPEIKASDFEALPPEDVNALMDEAGKLADVKDPLKYKPSDNTREVILTRLKQMEDADKMNPEKAKQILQEKIKRIKGDVK